MTVKDLRDVTFEGPAELKRMYDYAHSVFPIDKWRHDLGPFKIDRMGRKANRTLALERETAAGSPGNGVHWNI